MVRRENSGDPGDIGAGTVPISALDVSTFEDYPAGWRPERDPVRRVPTTNGKSRQ